MLARVAELARCLARDARRHLEYAMQAVDALARRLLHPAARLRASQQDLAHLGARLAHALSRRIDAFQSRIERYEVALGGLNPQAVLARGYSITFDAQGKVVTDAAQVSLGDRVKTTLARGSLESEVRGKR
jgi:exodeoxyribonuclease VII large subunit